MREHYLPGKWIELAKEAVKPNVSKEELEQFLKKTAAERDKIREYS